MAEETNPSISQEVITVRSGYANGFDIGVSLSDVSLVMMVDGQPLQKFHLSFTAAKTLGKEITNAIVELESKLEYEIKTMDEVSSAFERVRA